MGDESESVAAPNWMRELEAKREKRLKARLGHEAGAGAACLECKEKCPGLDLHFWRKICKNCKCGKENHDVQDDDLHGWVQLQLLGSKPKKPNKIVLPGKKDEVELEWAPKGSQEAVEKYLKDLPPELLPIKGSSAAQERKQLLQKQIPVHDVDPTLCHALTEEETRQMEDYINHMKENSVGVGQLVHLRTPARAQLVSSRLPSHLSSSENSSMRPSDLTRNLANLSIDPIYENIGRDYENIDAFGKHKLLESLEQIERKRAEPEFVCPAKAQYAMLLDHTSLPIKDKTGPIKANLDVFGNPVFDSFINERVGSAKPEYAILLDKNSVPILNAHGNPVKNPIERRPGFPENLGNRNSPHSAILLDHNHAPLLDNYKSPIKLDLDVFGAPILERALSEIINRCKPQYACYLDKTGAPLVDKYGHTIKYDLEQLKPHTERPQYALLLDKNRVPIKCKYGKPVIANLDEYGAPILDDYIVDKLNNAIPHYAMMLDKNGAPILDKHKQPLQQVLNVLKEPIFDKFGYEVRPQFGLLLDKNEVPIKDPTGSPIRVALDTFARPIMDNPIIEKLSGLKPEFVMYLDRNGAPILDKYGSPIKNTIYSEPVYDRSPKYGILLDKNQAPIKDATGNPVMVNIDNSGAPIINEACVEKLRGQIPRFVKMLDTNKAPIGTEPVGRAITNKFGNEILPKYALLLDANDIPLKDPAGSPIIVGVDILGRPLLNEPVIDITGRKPQYALLLDSNRAPILDKFGQQIKDPINMQNAPKYALLLDRNDTPIKDKSGCPIITNLDNQGRPVFNDHTANPQSALLLDANRVPVKDQFGNQIKETLLPVVPKYALLLDKNMKPLVDNGGKPVITNLDANGRPILTGKHQPAHVLMLDSNRAPLLDQFGNQMIEPVNTIPPAMGLLLDGNEVPMKDQTGAHIYCQLDSAGNPVTTGLSDNLKPEYAMLLDANGVPIPGLVKPMCEPLLDKYGNPIDIENVTLMDQSGRTILDNFSSPVQLKTDPFGRPVLKDIVQPLTDPSGKVVVLNNATLAKHNNAIFDKSGRPVQLKTDRNGIVSLHKTGQPVYDADGFIMTETPEDYAHLSKPVLDKYGNQIDPTTGRPIADLHKFLPQNRQVDEDYADPTHINIGGIRDITYPNYDNLPQIPVSDVPVSEKPVPDMEAYDEIPQCHRCKQIFEDQAVVIQIERSDALWHATCFKCAGCNHSLADMVYFFDKESDDIYCGRDFAKIRGIPRCNACDELIFVKEYCLAENETYHVKHFCCFQCDKTLAGENYVIDNNQPVCINCYENTSANQCAACLNIIKPDEAGANLNGTHFHASDDCFACKTCAKPLLGGKFLFRNVKLYCSGACYNQDQ